MRFTRLSSAEALREAGYSPISNERAELLRAYGVPLYQRGALPIAGTTASYFAPRWSLALINDWPLSRSLSNEDFDHYLLKRVIRRVVRTGDSTIADAALTVARLSGRDGLIAMFEVGRGEGE